jgi:hypothetical protein
MGCIPQKINVSAGGRGVSMGAKGVRVLVVEDEAIIRIMIADMLGELGHTLAAEAGHIDEAMRLAQSTEFDLAILDVNLRGKMITPVTELITARGASDHFRDRLWLRRLAGRISRFSGGAEALPAGGSGGHDRQSCVIHARRRRSRSGT